MMVHYYASNVAASLIAITSLTSCLTTLQAQEEATPALPGETDCQNLTCKNGGYCEYLTPLGEIVDQKQQSSEATEDEDEVQMDSELYCLCPLHWAGPTCEVPAEQCGDSVMYCYNRATCDEQNKKHAQKTNDDNDNDGIREELLQYTCDCNAANLYALEYMYENMNDDAITLYSGMFCEHPSTVICADDVVEAVEDGAFCANNGQCTIQSDGRYGCLCDMKWEGAHCEFRRLLSDLEENNPFGGSGSIQNNNDKSTSASSGGEEDLPLVVIILVTIGGLGVFAVTLYVISKKYIGKESLETMEYITDMEEKNRKSACANAYVVGEDDVDEDDDALYWGTVG